MKVQMQAVCTGIKTSKGEFEGRPFDSTTFQLAVDLGQTSSGESIGQVIPPRNALNAALTTFPRATNGALLRLLGRPVALP